MSDWTENISELYRQLAQIAVPARTEQLATLLTLLPFGADESFRVVELASGEGYLSAAILAAFPHAEVLALDYEASMRAATTKRLSPYDKRFSVDAFDILADDWFDKLQDADVVISSLCVHHLDANGKQKLFNAVQSRLSSRGVLLIADLVDPQTAQARELFAATWDSMAEAASIQQTLKRDLFELFISEEWNIYRVPDDYDKPSGVFEQLQWLNTAGFSVVDCFWMQAGHAIYGGYQQAHAGGIAFADALTIAQKILAS